MIIFKEIKLVESIFQKAWDNLMMYSHSHHDSGLYKPDSAKIKDIKKCMEILATCPKVKVTTKDDNNVWIRSFLAKTRTGATSLISVQYSKISKSINISREVPLHGFIDL